MFASEAEVFAVINTQGQVKNEFEGSDHGDGRSQWPSEKSENVRGFHLALSSLRPFK
jgi:hypothetical protein